MRTLKERYVVDKKGNKTDVIIAMSDYEKLLEDFHDLAVIAERREEIPVSMDEMKND
jgi:hypothetical protein